MEMDLAKDNGILDYSFLFNGGQDYSTPNIYDTDGRYHIGVNKNKGMLVVDDSNMALRANQVLMVGAYNNFSAPISASVTIKPYSKLYSVIIDPNFTGDASLIRTISMYLMIAISVVLLVLWLLFTTLRCN